MDMSDLTLIFFNRDRQFTIPRLNTYYSHLNARKIIYDSSIKPISTELIIELKSCGMEYVWLDSVPFLVAKNLAFSNVKTDYVMDCPDDDLFIIDSIYKALTILVENPEYVSCQGPETWYDPMSKTLFGCDTPGHYRHHLDNDLLVDDVIDRIRHEMHFFVGYAHCVHRTKYHLQNNRFLLDNLENRSGVWEEVIPGILSAIHGNRKVIPDRWVVRHRMLSRPGHAVDRICDGVGKETFFYGETEQILNRNTLNPISSYLSNSTGIDIDESYGIIKSVLETRKRNAMGKSKPVIELRDNPELSTIVGLMNNTVDFYK
tara:strand:+ start:1540 stop:2490 length:951 start_codon:yes stop_codon:yes gene_type:complete